jgi:uncharacterized membrane protein YfcA
MLLILIGFLSGIISGMGIGGGTILIPALVFFADASQHAAQSVNLAAFFPTALIALCIHTKNKHVKYKIALILFLAGALGAFWGSKFAVSVSSHVLRRAFGIFLLFMGLYELFRKGKSNKI